MNLLIHCDKFSIRISFIFGMIILIKQKRLTFAGSIVSNLDFMLSFAVWNKTTDFTNDLTAGWEVQMVRFHNFFWQLIDYLHENDHQS